nr:immunoglobulin heavy chain junction region [Mus musculus]
CARGRTYGNYFDSW